VLNKEHTIRVADPGFDDQKFEKNLQMKKKICFNQKLQFTLSLGLYKGLSIYRRSLQLSKENIQHFKT
jgi:hypothetical protein